MVRGGRGQVSITSPSEKIQNRESDENRIILDDNLSDSITETPEISIPIMKFLQAWLERPFVQCDNPRLIDVGKVFHKIPLGCI